MAIRTDLTVDWNSSPRLITVAAPSTEITIQDLVDTCREFEEEMQNLSHPRLIDAAGKEPLGGGVLVGITATLNNAQVAFEARLGPGWELMTISGGNLVALDDVGGEIDPRYPTAFTTIDRTASSSATLQESEAIQVASYAAHVNIDQTNGIPGTEYPVGTLQQPVNNFDDAVSIATARGFNILGVHGTYVCDGTEDISDYKVVGFGAIQSILVMHPSTTNDNTQYEKLALSGTFDNFSIATECSLNSITMTGTQTNPVIIRESGLGGTLTFSTNYTGGLYLFGANSIVPGANTPCINVNSSPSDIIVRNYFGGLCWENIDQGQQVSMDWSSGHVSFNNTNTATTIIVRGIGKLTDNSTATIDSANLIQTMGTAVVDVDEIVQGVWAAPLADHATPNTMGHSVYITTATTTYKMITDPVTGLLTIYEADGSTVLIEGQMYEGTDTSQTYRGQGAERRERLE